MNRAGSLVATHGLGAHRSNRRRGRLRVNGGTGASRDVVRALRLVLRAPGRGDAAGDAQRLRTVPWPNLRKTGTVYLFPENTPEVENRLYANRRMLESFTWDRLDGSFHGSGCTLASSIAGLLAQGLEPFSAIHEAQEYTWQSLAEGYRIGMGQYLPNRLFWARDEQD